MDIYLRLLKLKPVEEMLVWDTDSTNFLVFSRNYGDTVFQKITCLENTKIPCFPSSGFLINLKQRVRLGAQGSRPLCVTNQGLNLVQSFHSPGPHHPQL